MSGMRGWGLERGLFWLSVLGLYAGCILSPLLGEPARQTAHYWPENVLTYLSVWGLGALAGVCGGVRRWRRGGRAGGFWGLLAGYGLLLGFLLGG